MEGPPLFARTLRDQPERNGRSREERSAVIGKHIEVMNGGIKSHKQAIHGIPKSGHATMGATFSS
jgi:hypothetical protein